MTRLHTAKNRGYRDLDRQQRPRVPHLRFAVTAGIGPVDGILAMPVFGCQTRIIPAHSSAAVAPLLQATRTVPIVFTTVADPVGASYIDSLARPGGS
jgi:hypothetical protein